MSIHNPPVIPGFRHSFRDDLTPIKLPPVLAHIVGAPVAPRRSVEELIERAIEALDELDGDPDEEENDAEDAFTLSHYARRSWMASGPGCVISDCREDDDPAGDPLDEQGEAQTDDGAAMVAMRPIYGSDQSRGPTNEREAMRAHRLSIFRGG